ncbi:MAG: ferrous iron transport protein B [Planctomycetia bacterium]|nr:ferrous iron transport protein B [Planctomycetia bacterium]
MVEKKQRTLTIALVGNPNTGKTTLFNALSGLHQKTGNYPGVTVEKKTGTLQEGVVTIHLIDLPGTYSLAARSPDELVTVDLLLGQQPGESKPDLILNIVDATNLERHLFLTTQLMDLGIPIIVAVNMMDMARNQGIKLDLEIIGQRLGLPMYPLEAHRKTGLKELRSALISPNCHTPKPPAFPDAFCQEREQLQKHLASVLNQTVIHPAIVNRLLIDKQGAIEDRYRQSLGSSLQEARQRLDQAGCSVPQIEARTRYGYLRQVVQNAIERQVASNRDVISRIDRIVTHRVWGLLIFLLLLFVIFQAIYLGAAPLQDAIGNGIKTVGSWASGWLDPGPLKSLIEEGIFAGVGGVLVFLPQILILFLFLAILEDGGYMARAAYLMDKIMSRCGLSGKSFIPLLSSFACAIPGVMATRVIEDRRDRLATMLVAPLMSCSARLPVYTLLIGAFIPLNTMLGNRLPGLVLFCMYLIGLIVAPLVALILKRTVLKGETPVFILELPPYRWPSLFSVLHRMLERGWAFIRRAGTFILASMIIVWALLYFPHTDDQGVQFDVQLAELQEKHELLVKAMKTEEAQQLEMRIKQLQGQWKRQSYLGRVGHALEPMVTPLGWDWRIGTAALASFPAREVMVGVLGILFDVGETDDETQETLGKQLQETVRDDGSGRRLFSLATALSIMVFFALCCQCASTLAVIARESNSWYWPALTFIYMTLLAYVAAWATYQTASWLGAS